MTAIPGRAYGPTGLEVLPVLPDPSTDRQLTLEGHRLQADILAVLREILTAVQTAGGSQSSVELKVASSRLDPDPSVKIYANSPADGLVEAALDTFGQLKRESHERSMQGWPETLAALEAEQAA